MPATHRKHFFNENYFSNIDAEEKAYWLGFFYADGHITNNALQCYLQEDDREHLLKFLKAINANTIEVKTRKNGEYISYGINVCSKKLVTDMQQLGFTSRKTYDNTNFFYSNSRYV